MAGGLRRRHHRSGVAFAVALWYLGLVLLTERDDGRIQRRVREIRSSAE